MRSRWTRLLPIMMITFIIAFLDRTNIGFAIPYMGKELALGSTVLGFASGVLFLGYAATQPIGGWFGDRGHAKGFIAAALIAWGLVEMGQAFVTHASQLVIIRFVLGAVEGGIFPVFLIMVRKWFNSNEQSRANGLWQVCYPLAAAIGGPLSGYLVGSLGWRGMFVIEGILPIVWVAVWMWGVAESPQRARWLAPEERDLVIAHIGLGAEVSNAPREKFGSVLFRQQMKRSVVWMLVGAALFWNVGFIAFVIWLPSVLKQESSLSPIGIGWLSALPYVVAIFALFALTTIADKTMNRRRVAAVSVTVSGVALILGAVLYPLPMWISIVLLSLAASGIYGAWPVLWSIPTKIIPSRVLGIVLGTINGIAIVGAFGGPYVVGWTQSLTGSFSVGLATVGVSMLIAAAFVLAIRRQDLNSTGLDEMPSATTPQKG
jgi:MFS family permease